MAVMKGFAFCKTIWLKVYDVQKPTLLNGGQAF